MGTESCSLRAFLCSLHVGHARKSSPVFIYRITDLEAQIKTNKQILIAEVYLFWFKTQYFQART